LKYTITSSCNHNYKANVNRQVIIATNVFQTESNNVEIGSLYMR